jgi:hypothetical protein
MVCVKGANVAGGLFGKGTSGPGFGVSGSGKLHSASLNGL